MSRDWARVPLSKILIRSEEAVSLKSDESYKEVTVKLWGKGVVLRRETSGAEIAASRRSIVRAKQFIVSRIDARNGAFGLVPDELDGAVVSSDFPVFDINATLALPPFIEWLSKTKSFVDLCKAASEGTTNRVRLKEGRLLAAEIPLPPIEEQRRIVARIEEVAAKIEEARGLRREAAEEANTLIARANSQVLGEDRWEIQQIEKVLAEPPRNGLAPQHEVENGGTPMLRINAVSSSPTRFVDLTAYKLVDVSEEVAGPFTLKHNDVFIVRYNGDINRVARAAIFKADAPCNAIYPDKLMRLRVDQSKMLPDFLVYALGCETVRAQIEELGKTTAGQIGVSGKDAKSFRIPVPPLSKQRRIVDYLDSLQSKIGALKKFQQETAAELDALLPSLLDRAFKGLL